MYNDTQYGSPMRSNSNKLTIPDDFRPATFHAPEGTYLATLVEIYRLERADDPATRLIWRFSGTSGDAKDYLVGKTYEPNDSRKLLSDLAGWLGCHRLHDLKDENSQFDLDKLIGAKAEVTIVHIQNKSYPDPFCWISAIKPPGTKLRNGKNRPVTALEQKEYGLEDAA